MHTPSTRRRWEFDYHNSVAFDTSAIVTNRALLLAVLGGLLAIPGVAVYQASDGATAGSAGDGVNRWADAGDLIWANTGTAHSWIVLTLPAGLRYASPATAYLIIDLNHASAAGNLGTVLVAASVSGGSLTARPTGTQEVQISTADVSNTILAPSPTSGYHWHLQWAQVDPLTSTDATSVPAIRLFIVDDATGTVCATMLLEKPGDTFTGNVTDAVLGCWSANASGDSTPAPFDSSSVALFRYYDGASVDVAVVMRTYDGNFLEQGWGVISAEDGRRLAYPVDLVALTGPGTVIGRLPDAYFTDSATMYTLAPPGASSPGRAWITFGRLLVPHPSGSNPTGSATEVSVAVFGEAPVGASLASLTPVGGASLGATREEARWTPIELVVVVGGAGAVPLVWGYFGSDPGVRHVVYDGTSFTPFFEDNSTVTRSGDRYTFSVMPLGGWWDAPTLRAGAWVEAA